MDFEISGNILSFVYGLYIAGLSCILPKTFCWGVRAAAAHHGAGSVVWAGEVPPIGWRAVAANDVSSIWGRKRIFCCQISNIKDSLSTESMKFGNSCEGLLEPSLSIEVHGIQTVRVALRAAYQLVLGCIFTLEARRASRGNCAANMPHM